MFALSARRRNPVLALLLCFVISIASLVSISTIGQPPAQARSAGNDAYGCDLELSPGRLVTVSTNTQLQNAVRSRAAGDRIELASDANFDPLPIMEGRGGWSQNWITITAATGRTPTIVGTDWAGVDIREPFVQVCDLEVAGGATSTNYQDVTRVGISVSATHHVRLASNHIHNFSLGGINANRSNNLAIVGNDVHHNSFWGPEQGSGISVFHPSDAMGNFDDDYQIVIAGNVVHHNANRVPSQHRTNEFGQPVATDGNGIILDDFEQLQVRRPKRNAFDGWALVANNVTYLNGGRGIHSGPNGGRRIHIVNNTSYHNLQSAIDEAVLYDPFGRAEITMMGTQHQSSWEMRLINNIAIVDPNLDNEHADVMAYYRGNIADWSLDAHHNSFSGRVIKGFFNYPDLANSEAEHQLGKKSRSNAKPPFLAPGRGDFHLTSRWHGGSKAVSQLVGRVDLDGALRPTGNRSERGAFEYQRPKRRRR